MKYVYALLALLASPLAAQTTLQPGQSHTVSAASAPPPVHDTTRLYCSSAAGCPPGTWSTTPPGPPDTTPPPPPPPPPTPPPPSGTFTACDGLPTPLRPAINVSTQSQLASALNAALPGDRIVMAAGTYTGSKNLTRDGTAANPIVVCGPKTAHWVGSHYVDGMNRWILQGFTIRNGFQTFNAKRSSFNRLQGLEIHTVNQEAVHFLCNSTDNVMQGNWIYNTGTSTPQWGEAFYIGTWPSNASAQCGSSAADRSDRNQMLNNRLGPNVRSEDLDAKENTVGGIYRGNVSDGTGKRSVSGNFQSSVATKGSSSGWVFEDNVINGAAATNGSTVGDAFNILGSNHTFRRNTITLGPATGYGFRLSGSGHVCAASNVVNPSSRRSNVACNAP